MERWSEKPMEISVVETSKALLKELKIVIGTKRKRITKNENKQNPKLMR